MSASSVIFYIISAFMLIMALLSVLSKRIFRSAIYLLFCLIGVAALYFFLEYNFLGAVQVVVYVGGIVVLIIFSLFLTQGAGLDLRMPARPHFMFAGLLSLAGLAGTLYLLASHSFTASAGKAIAPDAHNIGIGLLDTGSDGYALPFELVSVLLLAAMIGCIVIALKPKAEK